MAVIQYKDSHGNIVTLNSIKGDRGPVGPRGPKGDIGPTGPKGGTVIRGSFPTMDDLLAVQHLLNINIGDGYIIENEESLYVWDGVKWCKLENWIPVKLDHLIDVTIDDNSLDHGNILIYDEASNQWTNRPLDADLGIFSTTEDIKIINPDGLGGYRDGEVILKGTNFNDFTKKLATKVIPPNYEQPTLKVTSNIDVVIERGKSVMVLLKPSFNPGDSGGMRYCTIYKDNERIDTVDSFTEYINLGFIKMDKNVTYKLELFYDEGQPKEDNLGNLNEEGIIRRGSIETELTIESGVPFWAFSTENSFIPTEGLIKSKDFTGLNFDNEIKLITTCEDNSRAVVFAYPKSFGKCAEIEYVGFDKHSKDIFTEMQIDIRDVNFMYPITYYVYYYIAPIEIGPATFVLSL